MSTYQEIGVTPVINASGYVTRLGGSLMLPEVVDAMAAAASAFVSMAELEIAAGRVIAEMTGAEAGYVTSGSAAALTLAAAVCMAGGDREAVNRLPDTSGMRNEIVIPGPHRDSYDRCFRVAGARIVTPGNPETCSPEALDAAIGPRTAAVGWFSMYEGELPLGPVVEIAHGRGVPVIVDAAVALPPAENLRRFTAEGADLVAFSGGKDMRGPQTTGFLAGRADLIAPLALHHQDFAANDGTWEVGSELGSPGHGLGRPMKVGKEELMGLLAALRAYPQRDHAAELAAQEAASDLIAGAASEFPGVTVTTGRAQTPGNWVRLQIDPRLAGIDAATVAERMTNGQPRIAVAHAVMLPSDIVSIGTVTLQPGEDQIVASRLAEVLANRTA